MRRRVVCPRSHPASPFLLSGSHPAERAQSIPALAELGYSVLRNWAIAISIIASPMTATIPSDSHTGTGHPPQVRPGASRCCAPAGTLQVAEYRVPHRADHVGKRVDPGQDCQPARQAAQRVERSGQEEQRHDQHLGKGHERLELGDPGRHHHAERRERERQQQQLAHEGKQQHRVVRHVREAWPAPGR